MIKLIRGFKYDNRYEFIKTFTNKQEQNSYFNTLSSLNIDDSDYVRDNQSFNVEYTLDYLVNEGINYLIFNNGYKDIYAFIIKKEYLGYDVTKIHFEVDVIQTYLFDFTIAKSYVERKKCTISEITDFDEGINIGEHIIENDYTVINKQSKWFAMFNGIKEQQLIFNDDGKLTDVVNVPFPTSKPLTIIDNIQYPIYFMPLYETYRDAVYEEVTAPGSGESNDLIISARKLLGLPYVWGGNYPPLGTDVGTDCSGLVQWAFKDCGLLENVGLGGRWTTYTMIEHATYIESKAKAKVGDVIFNYFSRPGVPEHVMLISELLEYNKIRIIEAPSEGIPVRERIITFDSSSMEIRRMI